MPCYTRRRALYWRFTEETGGKGKKSETGETQGFDVRSSRFWNFEPRTSNFGSCPSRMSRGSRAMLCVAGGFFRIRILANRGRSPFGYPTITGNTTVSVGEMASARLVFARFSHDRANLTTGHTAFLWITAMFLRQFGNEAPGFLPSLS